MNSTHRHRRNPRVLWAWLLALVLVGTQVLGMAHALAHASTPATTTTIAPDATDASAADGFGHDAGGARCALWSALLGASALTTTFAPQAALDSASPQAAWPARTAHLPRATAAFDARGPPASAFDSKR